jgi:nitroreductase
LAALPVEDRDSAIDASILAVAEFERESVPASGCLVLAARALGFDCRPIAAAGPAIAAEFFPGSNSRSILVCTLGYGDPGRPRQHGGTAARLRRGVPDPLMSSLSDVVPAR